MPVSRYLDSRAAKRRLKAVLSPKTGEVETSKLIA